MKNRQDVLKTVHTQEDKLFLSKMLDLSALCEKRGKVCFSSFLEQRQQQMVLRQIRPVLPGGIGIQFYGGYPDAQRKIAAFLPEGCEGAEHDDFPICPVMIALKKPGGEASHRDYLGTVLSLGLSRETVGDLLVYDDKCIVLAEDQIAQYICDHIRKVKNQGVKTALWEQEITAPKSAMQEICGSVSALRLDAVLALGCRASRGDAQKLVLQGNVRVNHLETENPALQLAQEDVLSVRGYGRFILAQVGGETRKGRIHVIIYKLL